MIKKRFLLALLSSVLFLMASVESAGQIKNLTVDDFIKTYKATPNAQLVDVRTPGEWSQGKFEKSALVNYNDPNFSKNIQKLDKNKPVFVYCAVGGRSSKAAQILNQAGYKVYNLTNAGYSQLASKGLK